MSTSTVPYTNTNNYINPSIPRVCEGIPDCDSEAVTIHSTDLSAPYIIANICDDERHADTRKQLREPPALASGMFGPVFRPPALDMQARHANSPRQPHQDPW